MPILFLVGVFTNNKKYGIIYIGGRYRKELGKMKKLEIILKEETAKGFEFYLVDLDKRIDEDKTIAVIKTISNPSEGTALEKVLKIVEEMYASEEYIVMYDKL